MEPLAVIRKAIAEAAICPECAKVLFLRFQETPPDNGVKAVLDLWNRPSRPRAMPEARSYAPQRDRSIVARLKDWPDLREWEVLLDDLFGQPWYAGENSRKWVADLRWLVSGAERFDRMMQRALANAKTGPVPPLTVDAIRRYVSSAPPESPVADASKARAVMDMIRRQQEILDRIEGGES